MSRFVISGLFFNRALFGLLTVLLTFAAPSGLAQSQESGTAPAGDAAQGRNAFIEHTCYSCHGFSAQGGAGPRLAQSRITFQAFRQYVRRPSRTMPPFGTQITDRELADIYAFIQSIPPSPDPKSIPLLRDAAAVEGIRVEGQSGSKSSAAPAGDEKKQNLKGNPAKGKDIFEANCAVCHEITADDKVGPGLKGISKKGTHKLSDGTEHRDHSPEVLRKQIVEGSRSMPQVGSSLSDQEMADLIAYLLTL
jgi:mono/diheme cytochrome c family protein